MMSAHTYVYMGKILSADNINIHKHIMYIYINIFCVIINLVSLKGTEEALTQLLGFVNDVSKLGRSSCLMTTYILIIHEENSYIYFAICMIRYVHTN
jgi:hypothetical protein